MLVRQPCPGPYCASPLGVQMMGMTMGHNACCLPMKPKPSAGHSRPPQPGLSWPPQPHGNPHIAPTPRGRQSPERSLRCPGTLLLETLCLESPSSCLLCSSFLALLNPPSQASPEPPSTVPPLSPAHTTIPASVTHSDTWP